MALGYMACSMVNQIGGAEDSSATQGNLFCKAEIEIVILPVPQVVVSPLACDEEWNSSYQFRNFLKQKSWVSALQLQDVNLHVYF